MGLLDDAIREHLDLKRRRGADPEEIERAEREALGPVRRAPEEAATLEPELGQPAAYEDEEAWDEAFAEEEHYDVTSDSEDQPVAPDGSLGAEEPPAGGTAEDPEEHATTRVEPAPSSQPPLPQQPVESAPTHEPEPFDHEVEPSHLEEPIDEQSAAAPTPPPAPASPAEQHQRSSEETAEYDVESALDEHAKPDEDVLEETPEFLQDTPDHDRLWFEQRPPRDFDLGD